MPNDEPTQPPVREPNTPRKFLRIAWTWLLAHPVWFAGIAGVLAGLLLPQIARMVF